MQKTRPTPQFLSETPSCEIPQGLERELCCVLTSELLGASSCGLGLPFDMVENSRVMKWPIQTLTTWAKKFTNYRGIQDDVQQNSLSSFILKTHPKGSWLFYFVPESSGNFILEVKKVLTSSDSLLRGPCIHSHCFPSHLLGTLLIAKLLIAKFPVLL